ncbi:nucleolar complex protein 2 [Trichomonascus vanleenenianus]|uniref:mRNA-binding ribosome synthesis protein NOC2 n=1 Tax=Trichomonascus vanleenenianus TaxID=2268995 RepID=UPI003ECA8140
MVDGRKKRQQNKTRAVEARSKKTDAQEDEVNSKEVFNDMSIEDFMEEGYKVPEPKKKKNNRKSKKDESESESESEDQSAMEKHRAELDKLAETDPEFYKYLKENDKEMLNFNPEDLPDQDDDEEDDDEDVEMGEREGSDDVEEDEEDEEDEVKDVVTLKMVKHWQEHLEKEHSLRTLKKVLRAFVAAVQYSEASEADSEHKYAVTDPEVFNALLVLTLTKVPETVKHHIPLSNGLPKESKKLKTLSQPLRSHAASLKVLLTGKHDAQTMTLILKSTYEMLPYFVSYRRLVKDVVGAVSDVFSASAEDESKLAAFDFLKRAATQYKKSLLEIVLKSVYSGIVKSSIRTNIHTMPSINLQKNLGTTLFDIDAAVSYQQGFQFIRQLAIHLRNSIVNKSAESYKTVYNWQYAHSLDFWSRVLCAQCEKEAESSKPSPLRELIHPLVQVTIGAMRLIPTPQYFPLRFYLIRSLIRLSQQTGVYIPLLPPIVEVLSSTTVTKTPKNTSLKPLDFDYTIRASKGYLGTRIYQNGVCDQIVELIGEFYALYCKSIAFPELAVPAIITLRRFIKRSKNIRFNKQLQQVVERLELNSKFIEQKRSTVSFGPTHKEEVNAFLKDVDWATTPLGKYVKTQREVREEQRRILRESMVDDEANEDVDDEIKAAMESSDETSEEEVEDEEESDDDE